MREIVSLQIWPSRQRLASERQQGVTRQVGSLSSPTMLNIHLVIILSRITVGIRESVDSLCRDGTDAPIA